MSSIVLASGNAGKIRELQALLPDVSIVPQSQWALSEAEETGVTFIENALIKARHAARHCQLPAIADDSGLVVDALGGAPGVYSARYAGPGASDADNCQKLLAELQDVPVELRSARFVCVLVYVHHADDPLPVIAQGIWEGSIMTELQGENGFGYDPLFWVPQMKCASAQLTPQQKNSLSHRGQALRLLRAQLRPEVLSCSR